MLVEILLFIVALFLWFYWYISKNFGKWESLGIPCISATFPWGSHKELLTQEKHINELVLGDYQKFKDKDYYGVYLFGKPVLAINSIDLIRDITVKHFNNFVNRNDSNVSSLMEGGDLDKLWKNQLGSLADDEWKDVRSTFSPIFTSGKMRVMFKFIKKIGFKLTTELEAKAQSKTDFELKEVFGKFSLDTLATCAFGIDPDSFKNMESTFVAATARIFINTFTDNIKSYSRRETGIRKNDLIDMMIDCIKDEGASSNLDANVGDDMHDQYDKDMQFSHHVQQKQFDEDIILATSLGFLIAGYDTTGMTLSFLAYDLGKNPEIQQRLQDEIDQAFHENGGEMPDYNTIQGRVAQ